jgi:hypothetical protein
VRTAQLDLFKAAEAHDQFRTSTPPDPERLQEILTTLAKGLESGEDDSLRMEALHHPELVTDKLVAASCWHNRPAWTRS